VPRPGYTAGRVPADAGAWRTIAQPELSGETGQAPFLNHSTIVNASEWLFHHPDDARFVPATLPIPARVTIKISSEARDFDGEPWFDSEDATVRESGANE